MKREVTITLSTDDDSNLLGNAVNISLGFNPPLTGESDAKHSFLSHVTAAIIGMLMDSDDKNRQGAQGGTSPIVLH